MSENYVENILIRQDNRPDVPNAMFEDDDCDAMFDFKGVLQLKQILKEVQNETHNRHTYVFKIVSIDKLKKDD